MNPDQESKFAQQSDAALAEAQEFWMRLAQPVIDGRLNGEEDPDWLSALRTQARTTRVQDSLMVEVEGERPTRFPPEFGVSVWKDR